MNDNLRPDMEIIHIYGQFAFVAALEYKAKTIVGHDK